jgi:hypothetical protein
MDVSLLIAKKSFEKSVATWQADDVRGASAPANGRSQDPIFGQRQNSWVEEA